MKRCKECKEIISLSLSDLLTDNKTPKRISKDNNYCLDCFNKLHAVKR